MLLFPVLHSLLTTSLMVCTTTSDCACSRRVLPAIPALSARKRPMATDWQSLVPFTSSIGSWPVGTSGESKRKQVWRNKGEGRQKTDRIYTKKCLAGQKEMSDSHTKETSLQKKCLSLGLRCSHSSLPILLSSNGMSAYFIRILSISALPLELKYVRTSLSSPIVEAAPQAELPTIVWGKKKGLAKKVSVYEQFVYVWQSDGFGILAGDKVTSQLAEAAAAAAAAATKKSATWQHHV